MHNFNELFFREHQKQMRKTLPSFSKALFCFYAILACAHPFFVPPPHQWSMSLISGISAIMFMLCSVYVSHKDQQLSEKNIVVVICTMAILAIANTFLHLVLTTDLLQSTNVLFICVALSAVGFSMRVFLVFLIFINCSWLAITWFFNLTSDPAFTHFVFTMIIGSFISALLARTRYKLLLFSVVEIMRRKNVETKLQVANNLLSKNANLDPLTGLPNRRFYDSFLKGKWQEVIESKASISLIIIDIDHFKTFNDDYGHQVGDEVLVVVGKTLAQCIRASTDLIARYGGEEFVAIVPNMSEHKTLQLAERMRQQISALEFKSKQITISLGSATIRPDEMSELSSLFKQADQALYDAKAQGRNRACHAKSDLGK